MQSQYEHLNVVREHLFWAKKIIHAPNMEDLHQAVAEKVNETMEQLHLLIEALKQSDHQKSQKPIV